MDDPEDYGEIDAVSKAKDRARKCFDAFVALFAKTVDSVMSYVLSPKHKLTTPSISSCKRIAHAAVMGFFNDRRQLISIVQKHSTDKQWKTFIETLAEGLRAQIKEYCKYRKEQIDSALGKATFSTGENFSFIKFPVALLESSKDVQVDLVVTGQLVLAMDELEGNEEYWRKLLGGEDAGKSPESGIGYLLSIVYSDLHNDLIEIIDGVAGRNPLLYAPLYMGVLQLSDAYKLGSVAYKLLGAISASLKGFKVKHTFASEGLRKVVYSLEEACDDAFNEFLVWFGGR